MSTLQFLGDLVLHLDRHLVELLARYDVWIYALLFAVIFCETGLVVTPFLPGDSLLFGTGALAAVDTSGTLRLPWLLPLLAAAAIAGNSLNYWIGWHIGRRAFDGRSRLFRLEHLRRAEDFFLRHGGLAIALSRFMPIVRTFTPFVAGVGRMPPARYQLYNILGGTAWVSAVLVRRIPVWQSAAGEQQFRPGHAADHHGFARTAPVGAVAGTRRRRGR